MGRCFVAGAQGNFMPKKISELLNRKGEEHGGAGCSGYAETDSARRINRRWHRDGGGLEGDLGRNDDGRSPGCIKMSGKRRTAGAGY